MILLIVDFPSSVPIGLGGFFFIDNIFRLFPQLSYGARRVFTLLEPLVFPLLTPIGLRGFFYLVANNFTYNLHVW